MSLIKLTKSCLLLLFFINCLFFSSCKDDPDDPVLPVAGCLDQGAINFDEEAEIADESCVYPELDFSVNFKVGERPFKFDSTYLLGSTKVPVKISKMKFFVSNVQLTGSEGLPLSVDNSFALVDPAKRSYPIGILGKGVYDSLTFDVGLNSANNVRTTNAVPGHPLADTEMFVSESDGYVFVKIRGAVDSDFDGWFSYPIQYDLGTVDLFRTISIPIDLDIVSDQNNEIELDLDLARLFENVDMSTTYQINFAETTDHAKALMDGFLNAIQ